MVGLVIATHGGLAAEMLATAKLIVGELPHAVACHVTPGTSPEQLRAELMSAVKSVDDGEGVLMFADLVGGSPCQQGLRLCSEARLEVVTGFNLPMLIKANALRLTQPSLTDLARELIVYGQKSISCATDVVRKTLG